MKKGITIISSILFIALAGIAFGQAVYHPLTLTFVATAQPGIQKLGKTHGDGKLLWSSAGAVAAGGTSRMYPCSEFWCAFLNEQSTIFLINLAT